MPLIEVTIRESVSIPEGSEIVLAPTGVVSGVKLPSGEFIKPWINWELFASSDENQDSIGDLGEDELNQRDVHTCIDFERTIWPSEDDVPVDASAVKSN